MTSNYPAYLEAVATLHEQSDRVSAELAAAETNGQADLDAAARRVREAEEAGRDASLRLRTVNERLARLARDVQFDLEPVGSTTRPATSLVEAGRMIADLQREVTAIEGSCDWLRRNRSAIRQAAPTVAVITPAVATPTAVMPAVESAPPAKPVWQNPAVWIAVALAVIIVLVVLLIVK